MFTYMQETIVKLLCIETEVHTRIYVIRKDDWLGELSCSAVSAQRSSAQISCMMRQDVAGCGRMWILLCADDISLVCDDMDSLKTVP